MAALSTGLQLAWVLAFPLVVRYGLQRHALGLLPLWSLWLALLLGTVLSALLRMVTAKPALVLTPALQARPLLVDGAFVALLLFAAALDQQLWVLLCPTLLQLSFAWTFGRTLLASAGRPKKPLIERFAELIEPNLTDEERRYCRSVTGVWTGFFLLNAVACTLLAALAPLDWWAWYVGVLGYLLAAALGAVEYVVRKLRFRRFTNRLHDRWLARLMRGAGAARRETISRGVKP